MRELKSITGFVVILAMFSMVLVLHTLVVSAADVNVQAWTIGISINDMRTQGS